jgi:hypothetical protein
LLRSILVACALILTALPAAAQGWWVVRDAHLRAHPDPDSRSRGVIHACDLVDVVQQIRGWVRVESDIGFGWLRARHVAADRPRHCGGYRPRIDIIIHPPLFDHPGLPYPGLPHPVRPRPDPYVPPMIRPIPTIPLEPWNRWHDW